MSRAARARGPEAGGRGGLFAMPAPGRPAGFTLVEVLLAVAILAVVMTAVYSSFATAGRAVEQAGEVRDGTDLARTLISRMLADLANAYVQAGMSETFLYGRKAEDDANRRFDSIFLTTLTNWRKPGSRESELWEVGYYFEEKREGTGRVLLRKEKRELSKDLPPLEGTVDLVLTDAVEGLRLRYYDGSTWIDEWDTKVRGRVPKAVEVALSLAGGRVYATQIEIRNP